MQSKDVVLAIASTLTTTDPWDANDTLSHACAKTFYEGLFGFNEKLELRPVLAESYDVSPDGARVHLPSAQGCEIPRRYRLQRRSRQGQLRPRYQPGKQAESATGLYSNIAKTEVVDDLHRQGDH